MKAMILAAGLGTRLRPWTLEHPKALVPVGGVPMLQRVIMSLRDQGFRDIVVNVHHFASQITDFLASHDFGVDIKVSDESDELLDTGGALLKARKLLDDGSGTPFLVHNVDILSDAPLRGLMDSNLRSEAGVTLLVSRRDSYRRLLFDSSMRLRGWRDNRTGKTRPERFVSAAGDIDLAFSGIYVVRPSALDEMTTLGLSGKFPVMDYFLSPDRRQRVEGFPVDTLHLIDIGKPETLKQACGLFEGRKENGAS